MTRAPVRSLLLLSALAQAATGCVGASEYMTRGGSNAPSPQGAVGVATVVFFRPSTFAYGQNFRVIDHAGRFVGDTVAGSYFVVTPPPGDYVFVLGDDDIDVLYANLVPGLVYYVDVVPVPGSFVKRARFRPIRRNDATWRELPVKLLDRMLVPAFDKGQAALDRDPGLRSRVDRAKKKWAEMSPGERNVHSIGPGDAASPALPLPSTLPPR